MTRPREPGTSRLRVLRNAAGLTVNAAAANAKVTVATWVRYEAGCFPAVTAAKGLRVKTAELVAAYGADEVAAGLAFAALVEGLLRRCGGWDVGGLRRW